ncbi:hypothetical protein TWF718_006660 [Orbilia javanica]|uniref:MARVEL domain-containing protein n=1 Tax=Orbilia javanica TaxID=47235 RepID=A0AAN8MS61_9PEZI
MAGHSGGLRGGLLALRLLEFIFAVILVGVFSWDHATMKKAGYFSFYVSDVPLGFSVAALVLSVMAGFSHLFFHRDAQILFGVFDLFLFIGYIASCIVYRQNFHVTCGANVLVRVFATVGSWHCGTVRLGAALLILQTILFFCTTLMTFALAGEHENVDSAAAARGEKSRFGLGRRNQEQQSGLVQPEATTV